MWFYRILPYCFFFFLFWGISACQTSGKKRVTLPTNLTLKPHPKPPAGYTPQELQLITHKGVNRFPHLSKDQNQMLFVSGQRDKHEHTQVYLLDLRNQKEQRITFQDGQLSNPQFMPETLSIIYESTTDEDKEQPPILQKHMKSPTQLIDISTFDVLRPVLTLPSSEIYLSDLKGQSIVRLTNSPQFDGSSQVVKNHELIFSSMHKRKINLFRLIKKKKQWRKVSLKASEQHLLQARMHGSTKHLAWVQLDPQLTQAHILWQNPWTKEENFIANGQHFSFSPHWHPNAEYLLFTSNQADRENYELYVYDLNAKCLKRLSYLSSMEIDPIFSPDGHDIYFASDLQGTLQIYKMKFQPPESCSLPTLSVKI